MLSLPVKLNHATYQLQYVINSFITATLIFESEEMETLAYFAVFLLGNS